jgi:hypothetical protein
VNGDFPFTALDLCNAANEDISEQESVLDITFAREAILAAQQ